MDHDTWRCEAIQKAVQNNIEMTLTHSRALHLAAKFSNGAACTEGAGNGGPSVRGSFNICYWVQVEGEGLWVVRFSLIGMLPWKATVAKVKSEVATLQFLSQKTAVRVPWLIGYGLGDNEFSVPFIIMQHVDGLTLNTCWRKLTIGQPGWTKSFDHWHNNIWPSYLSRLTKLDHSL